MENSQKPDERRDIKQAYRTAYLIAGFLKHTLTEEEKEELDAWILASEDNMILFEKMIDDRNIEQAADWFKKMNVEAALQETKSKLHNRRLPRLWLYTVAAAIVVSIVAGVYMYKSNSNKNDNTIATAKQDIMPGSSAATLTLSNGQQIVLNNEGADTTINKQTKLLRKDGQLVYTNDPETKELVYNTLTVPRKGQYKLVLPDGSKVWLNAESSIKYPVAFIGNERKVFITGEAFFEVAKNRDKPFRVVAGNVTLEDLGTQFNVNDYDNEPYLATTLVEGSVKVTSGSKQSILKPGQQAQVMNDDLTIGNANVEEVTAWKNNEFKFSGTSIDEIMRQVERWYDADVEFKDSVSLHLNATIDRSVPASKLLHILEQTGQVHFKIEGKKIIVMN
jgi:ferric-dicitrate binding protein FerR (iron transport regulator)